MSPYLSTLGTLPAELHRRVWSKTLRPRLARARHLIGGSLLPVTASHLYGPRRILQGPEELVATCVVRNGALHVRSFIEHHQGLGVTHIVFLDNGSTDGTVDIIREHSGVTVLRSKLPYRWLENQMKEFLSRRFCTGRWNLCLDVDELWMYPFASKRTLPEFLGYLDAGGFDAVACQMLDMFSRTPLPQLTSRPEDTLLENYPYYDITGIEKGEYRYGTLSNLEIRMHYGGIRRQVFGTDNWLTKAALVRVASDRRMFVDTHFAEPAYLADVSCVLLHFPFVATFPQKVAEAVRTGRYAQSAQHEYEDYQRVMADQGGTRLYQATAKRLTAVDDLVDEGFLVVSERYRQWAGVQ